jgi:putative transposase
LQKWLQLTQPLAIRNSMCETPYENAHAERINGIIKNDYLIGYGPATFTELEKMTAKATRKYNEEKPHGSLRNLSPYKFELTLVAA